MFVAKSERKGKKRPPRKPEIDEDLSMLASVIGEFQLDNTAYGWFRPPWRDGLWAVALALGAARAPGVADGIGLAAEQDAAKLLDWFIDKSHKAPDDLYEQAGSIYSALVQPKINTNTARLLAAALRCLQLKLARSDGGGAVYNEVLIPAFLPLEPKHVASLVLLYRCNDAIGTSHHLKGDHNDRQRQAFRIAWERGLYLAAYSLPPAY